MISLYNIRTIAKYETKILLRSWIFRIFAILSLLIICFINFFALANVGDGSRWELRGLSSTIPYITSVLLSVSQTILAIFLSSNFIKQDQKLDTSEVIFSRSISNGDYILGKTLGNLKLYFVMTFITYLIAIMANFIAPNVDVQFQLYLYYFLIINIPTLIFIFGLSYFIVITTKNIAISYLLILSYCGATLFLIQDQYNNLFDFMGFFSPLNHSDFTGFMNLNQILIQRGIYLFIGISLILFTIGKTGRLVQSKKTKSFSYIGSFIFICLATYLISIKITENNNYDSKRIEYLKLNNEFSRNKNQIAIKHDINLIHNGNNISATSTIVVKNKNQKALSKLLFSLNPGLKIKSLSVNNKTVKFNRKQHLIFIPLKNILKFNDTLSLQIKYSGNIDETFMYLDIPKERLTKVRQLFIAKYGKKFSYITSDYLLLTNEAYWYPTCGVTFSSNTMAWFKPNFCDFSLTVEENNKLVAISQGTKTKLSDNKVKFTNHSLLPEITLILGKYLEQSVQVDSVNYRLIVLEGHNFYSKSLTHIKDTLPSIIRELSNDYERSINIKYPYKSFSIIETPIQYFAPQRLWTNAIETVQPQMVLIPEKGIKLELCDFMTLKKQNKKRNKRNNNNKSEFKIETKLVKRFFKSIFLRGSNEIWQKISKGDHKNPYSIFPTYYSFSHYIESENWGIFNMILEIYLQEKSQQKSRWGSDTYGLSIDENANIELQKYSFEEIFATDLDFKIVNAIVENKALYLMSILKKKVGINNLSDFIHNFNNKYISQYVSFKTFNKELKKEYNIDLESYMTKWYTGKELPSFIFSSVKCKQVKNKYKLEYVLDFKIQNVSNYDGIVITKVFKDWRNTLYNKPLIIEKNTTRKFTIVLEEKPKNIKFNTLTSNNIPSKIETRIRNIKKEKKKKYKSENKIIHEQIITTNNNEIIIDNTSKGFEIINNNNESSIKKFINSYREKDKKKYVGRYRLYPQWRLASNSKFYGDYIKSAYKIKSGNGNQFVRWNFKIKNSGDYEVYAHVTDYKYWGRRKDKKKIEYNYKIFSTDNETPVIKDITTDKERWKYLGTYYFSEGKSKIELSNKSNYHYIVADAIKLVKED